MQKNMKTSRVELMQVMYSVNSYDASSATVTLITKYPSHTSTKAKGSDLSVQARLDVSLVLPPITPKELFEVGTWLTVIGYVAYAKPGSSRTRQMSNSVEVQVLMLLSSGEGTKSGGMQDERYIRAVEARRKGMRVMEKAREAYGSC